MDCSHRIFRGITHVHITAPAASGELRVYPEPLMCPPVRPWKGASRMRPRCVFSPTADHAPPGSGHANEEFDRRSFALNLQRSYCCDNSRACERLPSPPFHSPPASDTSCCESALSSAPACMAVAGPGDCRWTMNEILSAVNIVVSIRSLHFKLTLWRRALDEAAHSFHHATDEIGELWNSHKSVNFAGAEYRLYIPELEPTCGHQSSSFRKAES